MYSSMNDLNDLDHVHEASPSSSTRGRDIQNTISTMRSGTIRTRHLVVCLTVLLRLVLQIMGDAWVVTIDHNLHNLAVVRCRCRGVHSLPLLGALVSFAGGSVRHPSRLAASAAEVVEESEDSECDTEGQDGASDTEGTTVFGLVVFAEDLRTVDTSDVCAHDDQCHGEGTLLGIIARKGHPRDVERMREGSEYLSPDHAEVAHVTATKLREATIEDIA